MLVRVNCGNIVIADGNRNSAARAVATLRATASQCQTQQRHRKQTIFYHYHHDDRISQN
jgi:hypothetical protein